MEVVTFKGPSRHLITAGPDASIKLPQKRPSTIIPTAALYKCSLGKPINRP
jgi:hypothetical protein